MATKRKSAGVKKKGGSTKGGGTQNRKAKSESKKSGGKKSVSKAAKSGKAQEYPLRKEIVSILLLAAGILLTISVYTQYGTGFAGELVNKVIKGLFGFGANFLPFIVIGMGIYSLFETKRVLLSQFLLALSLFACIISFVHVMGYRGDLTYASFGDYIATNYRNGSVNNGGLIGAIFGNFFIKLFDVAGTYIFLTAAILILMIMLTGRSIFKLVYTSIESLSTMFEESRGMSGSYDDEYFEEYEEEYDEEYEEYYEEKPQPKPAVKPPVKPKPAVTVVEAPATAKQKAPVFTINEREVRDGPILALPQDEILKNSRNPVVLKGYDKNKISDIITIRHDGEEVPETDLEVISDSVDERIEARIEARAEARATDSGDWKYKEPEPDLQEILPHKTQTEYGQESDNEFDRKLDEDTVSDEWFEDVKISGNIDGAENDPTGSMLQDGFDDEFNEGLNDGLNNGFNKGNNGLNGELGGKKPEPTEIKVQPPVPREKYEYHFPSIEFLLKNPAVVSPSSRASILETSRKLEETLKSFNVEAKVIEVSKGPTVTRYELSPGQGVKVSKISGLADDLALNLAASGIRIEAPIPGKAAVGIEVPNKEVTPVYLREVIGDEAFKDFPSKLAFALGKDIAGNTVVTDIAKMPHLLIAGATGSGKSVCVNTLITSIIYKATPDEVKLLMVDPKVVELSIYNGIPHLLIPVVTDAKKAAGALGWAVKEMIDRYGMFAETSVRDLKGYNAVLKELGEDPLPQIVIIIDELADLMMAAPGEVEDSICRLAQMARAAGLHLIIATQRPSVDVITGLIKANVPSRLAFSVSSGTDSRTILDMVGAEKLLGKGDMLFFPVGMSKPLRVQGAFISDKEVENIVNFVKKTGAQEYDQEMIDKITTPKGVGEINDEVDEFFEPAIEFIIEKEKASASMLQRKFRIGYNRASNLIEELESRGIVGPEDGSKPRKVLMTKYAWDEYKAKGNG